MGKEKLKNEDENLQKKKRREYGKKDEYRKGIDYEDGNKIVNWYGNIVELISEYGMGKMLQAFLLIVASVFFLLFANALNNEEIIEQWITRESDDHAIGTNIRTEISPKVNNSLLKLMYELDADRVSVLEMHNGKENPTSLPFIYCDMTYEHTKGKLPYVSEEYEDLNMAKFTFPYYIYDHKYFIGSIEEVFEIDKRLAMRLDMNNVKYMGIIIIRGTNDIGFLMVSFNEKPEITDEVIRENLSYYVQEVGAYLDYHVQNERKKQTK